MELIGINVSRLSTVRQLWWMRLGHDDQTDLAHYSIMFAGIAVGPEFHEGEGRISSHAFRPVGYRVNLIVF